MTYTTVFAYKGIIGIDSTPTDEGMIAPYGNGNIGVVTDADKVRISPDALSLLKTIKKGRDYIGDVDTFKCNDKSNVFSWFGGHKRILDPAKSVGSRDYNPSLLKVYEGDIEIPDDFKVAVMDKLNSEGKSID